METGSSNFTHILQPLSLTAVVLLKDSIRLINAVMSYLLRRQVSMFETCLGADPAWVDVLDVTRIQSLNTVALLRVYLKSYA